ncbi:M28 family metallopeptidase [Nocardioides pinisoli]|uniref:M28 family metallopeptidase n=1 Tax=Nocardioides pinisoli TaxID=2950279 RepID=A0ABT1KWU2_9ACTN|nr:M28 family metallopeptidase [Nocardioides pinisoli]MCP3422237.1 M28 family metallopeptidase [Nocardioides pinisoli]
MPRRIHLAVTAAATAALLGAMTSPPAYADPNNNTVRKLTKAVTADGVVEHLEALQDIADANGGDRAAGRPGYKASVDYVVEQLEAAGYDPTVQEFPFTYAEEFSELERISPNPRVFEQGSEFLRNTFDSGTPEGTATGTLFVIPAADTTDGCEAGDYAGMAAGQVALIQRGGCGFAIKALAAQAAGASGAIIYNNTAGMINMIGDATGLRIPVVFASQVVGEDLATTPGATVRVEVDFTAEQRTAYNVLAETASGDDDNTVMAGAHLDSVQGGAGIQDNGSGSAALLETAIQMAKVKPTNTVRFAWWGAEEEGLLGSEHYVEQLSEEEAEDIALYLNFDMIASPNYMFGIYDGDNSGGTAAPGFIPDGSAQIEDVFEKFYADRGEPSQDSEFSGRSDYGPFIAVGIPAGGLFTGAEVRKTAGEAALYGGVAGASYDPCYHESCDNLTGAGQDVALYEQLREDYTLIGNVNVHALDVNSDAIATAIMTFAYDTSTVNGAPGHPGRGLVKSGAADRTLAAIRDQRAR